MNIKNMLENHPDEWKSAETRNRKFRHKNSQMLNYSEKKKIQMTYGGSAQINP